MRNSTEAPFLANQRTPKGGKPSTGWKGWFTQTADEFWFWYRMPRTCEKALDFAHAADNPTEFMRRWFATVRRFGMDAVVRADTLRRPNGYQGLSNVLSSELEEKAQVARIEAHRLRVEEADRSREEDPEGVLYDNQSHEYAPSLWYYLSPAQLMVPYSDTPLERIRAMGTTQVVTEDGVLA